MNETKIVFWELRVRVASLGALLMNGMDVAMVVTAPDKPAGRGRKIISIACQGVRRIQLLPVLQPENLEERHL